MAILFEKPYLRLPAADIPRHAGFHTQRILLGAPADEATGTKVSAELILIQCVRPRFESLEGILSEHFKRDYVLVGWVSERDESREMRRSIESHTM
jgi:hypothetical protein